MNLEDLLRFLQQGDPEAAAYLNDPNSRPEIGRTRPPMFPAPPQATMGPDGMRLPLPRIQGGAMPERQRIVANPLQRYPLVYGPSVADANSVTPRPPQFPAMTMAPTMRFRDAAAPLGPEMIQETPPVDREPWRQPAPTPLYQGGGIYGGISDRGLPQGDPAGRGFRIEPTEGPGLMARNGRLMPGTAAAPEDDDAAWNAARARVQAEMGRQRDPTGMRAAREGYLRPYSARAQRAQMIADGRARMGRPSR